MIEKGLEKIMDYDKFEIFTYETIEYHYLEKRKYEYR